jgi:hypothetical protein
MDRYTVTNTVSNTFITKLSAELRTNFRTKLTVNLTVINSFKTSVQQRLSSTPILDNASKR